jgi:hypothetical protein
LVALVVLGVFLYGYLDPKPKFDSATYCPLDGPVSSTAVIIDTTDSINEKQKVAIENEFSRVLASISRFGQLAIYAAGFQGEVSKPEFALCNPGSANEIDWLKEGKILAEKRWKEGFLKPLEAVLKKMLTAPPAQKTPLLEAVQSVSLLSFGPLRAKEESSSSYRPTKRLILISDLLQHSEHLSLYGKPPPLQKFLKSEAYRAVRADLRGVEVHILFIRRQTKGNYQNPELTRFWEELVAEEGGRIVHFKPLEG